VFGTDGKLVYKGLVDDDQMDRNAEGRWTSTRACHSPEPVVTGWSDGERPGSSRRRRLDQNRKYSGRPSRVICSPLIAETGRP